MQRIALSIVLFLCLGCFMEVAIAREATLKEKIGQMLIVGFKGMEVTSKDAIVQSILAQEIGGVILFDYDYPTRTFEHNIKSPEQVKQLTKQLQDFTQQAASKNSNNLFPLIVSVDYEGGKVNRLKESYGFPKTLSAEEIGRGSKEQAIEYAGLMAKTLADAGINLNFAPVLDVNVNPDNPVIGKLQRSFSADPQKVVEDASIFTNAYRAHGILCAYKHFPGHGSSTGDTHEGFVDVTQTWKEYELDPYKQLLNQPQSCDLVMTAHVVHYGLDSRGYPATISLPIIKELLREKLNYRGVVITDDMQMKAIADRYGLHEAVRLSINAGADMLVFGNQLVDVPQNPKQIVDMIYDDVMTGKISENRINEAFDRIMQLKEKLRKTEKVLNPAMRFSNQA